jgi:2-dehydro-3-deoxygluconokinase
MIWDLIALGETMAAFTPSPGQSWQSASEALVDHAGAESNTCVGLARLGLRVAWVSRLGLDGPGDRILDALRAERVDTQFVLRDGTRPTGIMLKDSGVVRYYRSQSAASAINPQDLADVPVGSARAVLVTGVTALIGPEPQAAGLALLARASGIRIVDPNLRAGLWGSARRVELVRPFIEHCDLVLGGAAEFNEIFNANGNDEALARRATECGPREVVVRGADSVGAMRDGQWWTQQITRSDAVDPIGAGDAFNAGYIAVRLRGGSVDAALAAGVRCGDAVTTAPSDTSAFPRTLV